MAAHVSEAGNEALVGVFEGEFGLDTKLAGHVDRGEKKVPEFVLEPLRIARFQFGGQLGKLLLEFFDHPRSVRPVEADSGGFLLDVGRADEGGQGAGNILHDGGSGTLFLALDLFPLPEDGLGVACFGIAEDMRVTPDKFLAGVAGGIFKGEGTTFGGQIGVENDLKQNVAEFLAQIGIIGFGNGVDGFAGFLEESGAEGFVGLLAVPWAAFG